MSRVGMSKDGRKMSLLHLTPKAGVIYTQCAPVYTRVLVLYADRSRKAALSPQSAFCIRVHIFCPVRNA